MSDFIKALLSRRPELESCVSSVESAYDMLSQCLHSSGKLLLCGNGGSAADCEHWSGEMLKGFEGDRPVSARERELMGDDLADKLQGALPVIPLASFISLSSAYANDCHSAYIFAQLTLGLGRPGDVLVAISTSGNSQNIIYAARTARAIGLKVVGLTGHSGGSLKELCDVCICAPAERTFEIQEMHLPIYHTISLMLEEDFFPS